MDDEIAQVVLENSRLSKKSRGRFEIELGEKMTHIYAAKHINREENNRPEYLFVNYDYYDGNDLAAKILHEKCGLKVGDKIEGEYFSIIPLYENDWQYILIWHEDIGNYIFSEKQGGVKNLEKYVKVIESELNRLIQEKQKPL